MLYKYILKFFVHANNIFILVYFITLNKSTTKLNNFNHRLIRNSMGLFWTKTKNQKPKTKNQKPKTKNQKPKTQNQKPKNLMCPPEGILVVPAEGVALACSSVGSSGRRGRTVIQINSYSIFYTWNINHIHMESFHFLFEILIILNHFIFEIVSYWIIL